MKIGMANSNPKTNFEIYYDNLLASLPWWYRIYVQVFCFIKTCFHQFFWKEKFKKELIAFLNRQDYTLQIIFRQHRDQKAKERSLLP